MREGEHKAKNADTLNKYSESRQISRGNPMRYPAGKRPKHRQTDGCNQHEDTRHCGGITDILLVEERHEKDHGNVGEGHHEGAGEREAERLREKHAHGHYGSEIVCLSEEEGDEEEDSAREQDEGDTEAERVVLAGADY